MCEANNLYAKSRLFLPPFALLCTPCQTPQNTYSLLDLPVIHKYQRMVYSHLCIDICIKIILHDVRQLQTTRKIEKANRPAVSDIKINAFETTSLTRTGNANETGFAD